MPDADVAVEVFLVWWAELLGAVLGLAGVALAALRGDAALGLVSAAFAVVLVDRVRLRMDNRSLARQLGAYRRARGEDAVPVPEDRTAEVETDAE